MIFKKHSGLAGQHAFLSPSNYHWINYNEQKLEARYHSVRAAKKGTDLHELAHKAIELGIPFPKSKNTINLYVNDGIRYGMTVEQPLYYSDNCFGTADTISFKRNLLRIHDYKSGITKASHHQLEVYAALFCLEYEYSPFDIEMDLRIYQNDEVICFEIDPQNIADIMDTIIEFDLRIELMREKGMS